MSCVLSGVCKFERLYKLDVLSISRPWTTAADQDAEGYVSTPSTAPLPCAEVLSIIVSLFERRVESLE